MGVIRKNLDINGNAHDYLADVQKLIDTKFSVTMPIGTIADAGLFWDGRFIMHEYYAYNGGYGQFYFDDLVTMHTL